MGGPATGCAFYSQVPCALQSGDVSDADDCADQSAIDAIYFRYVTVFEYTLE